MFTVVMPPFWSCHWVVRQVAANFKWYFSAKHPQTLDLNCNLTLKQALFKVYCLQVINEDYNTKLRVVDAKRSDAGTYTLVAKNINGKDTATVNVLVLGE